jgi:DNA-directed RNA polymerase beta subunit
VFRALGIVTDKQIIEMCLLDLDKYENMIELFRPSVHDNGPIYTQAQALRFIGSFTKYSYTKMDRLASHAHEIMTDYFLPHVGETNFVEKAYFLGNMVFRLLSVHTGLELPTDRDNLKYKRVELVGTLMHQLFREYWKMQKDNIRLGFERKLVGSKGAYKNDLPGLIRDYYQEVFSERIVDDGVRKAFKGNWGHAEHNKRIGVIQDMNRLSHNGTISHLRKTNLPITKYECYVKSIV